MHKSTKRKQDNDSTDEEIDGIDDSAPGGSTDYPYSKLTNKLTPNTEVLHEWMNANQLPHTNQGIFSEQYAILRFTRGVVPPELKKKLNPHPFRRMRHDQRKPWPGHQTKTRTMQTRSQANNTVQVTNESIAKANNVEMIDLTGPEIIDLTKPLFIDLTTDIIDLTN